VEYTLITRNKKIIFENHTHERVTQVISEGLLYFESHTVSVRMSRDPRIIGDILTE
jgi:hypothetical protein